MNTLQLNIGRDSATLGRVSVATITGALMAEFNPEPCHLTINEGVSTIGEPTVIAEVHYAAGRGSIGSRMQRLCWVLGQECIAGRLYAEGSEDEAVEFLAGPGAERWGARFDARLWLPVAMPAWNRAGPGA